MTPLTAIVTGALRGIGLAISKKLLQDGYRVLMVDISPEAEGRPIVQPLGVNADYFSADIASESDVEKLYQHLQQKFGALDLLVNNAGIIRDNMIHLMPTEDFDKVIDVNLKGTWLMCKYAAVIFRTQSKGRIVNITSRAWLGNKGQSNYAASKAGVVGLTRVLALELGKYNVLVNAIAPGLIDTPLTQGLKEETRQQLINAQPTRSMGRPEDIANAVAFLGSYDTEFITGQTLYVDGGKSIGSNL